MRITVSELLSILVLKGRSSSYFFASDNFKGTFIDFHFLMFTEVLMKELARIPVDT